MGDLRQSFDKTKLDLENPNPDGFHKLDTITTYPALSTGTPTSDANPGAPLHFNQPYTPSRTYLDNIPIRTIVSPLNKSLNKTNLDLENPNPDGFYNSDTVTTYPALSTGTPTSNANPGAPSQFNQSYTPNNTYLDKVPIKTISSSLNKSLNKTNLDITDPGVDGGIPYKQIKDPTEYPITTQGRTPISGYNATPGRGATKFDQKFSKKLPLDYRVR